MVRRGSGGVGLGVGNAGLHGRSRRKEAGEITGRRRLVESYLEEGAELRLRTASISGDIERAGAAISRAFRKGAKLVVFGNGGSAADAQHIAAEFSGRFRRDRKPLPGLALTTNSSALTAIGNDFGFDEVFARQVRALVRRGDVVLGISTSGDSENVLRGMSAAREAGAVVIGLCGKAGAFPAHADIVLAVPAEVTSLLQEVHIAIGHILCLIVEADLSE